ncbi:unnamed protein product [Owenia fusiformis]|uniref:DNA 5'-3' helicase n=1 Tax=Owenia fusiformis TaxID=6347 RepID=A0A8S4Q5H8_OWEFU|nr:unnamed protein product [Owenia fusiformis]
MPTYKLMYFRGRGNGELLRLLFAQAEVKYEDVRLRREEWEKIKPTSPFGVMPMLQIDDTLVGETGTIARYIARENGLAGNTSVEQALAESVVDSMGDVKKAFGKALYEKDDERKAEFFKQAMETLDRWYGFITKMYTRNSEGKGWLVGDSLTLADIAVFSLIDLLNMKHLADAAPVVDKHPLIVSLRDKDLHGLGVALDWNKRGLDRHPINSHSPETYVISQNKPAMASPATDKEYTIGGVKVKFPHKAYPSQLSMMSMIVKGLAKSQNSLLESPTGSGKSLALLCSALAWVQHEKEKNARHEDTGKADNCNCHCHEEAAPIESATEKSPYFNNETCNTNDDTCDTNQEFSNTRKEPSVDLDFDDFKAPQRFRTPTTGRSHTKIGYEDSPTTPFNKMDSPSTEYFKLGKSSTEAESEGAQGGFINCDCACRQQTKRIRVPKIYFGTRTHKQITQIVRELNKTSYSHNTRMCILSSREQGTCIHPIISEEKNKTEGCHTLLDHTGCSYMDKAKKVGYNTIEGLLLMKGKSPAYDIEDLVDVCKTKSLQACPYFLSRNIMTQVDIVFCPYNYLIDANIRASLSIDLKNDIVILDEAHNIEDSARDAASFTVGKDHLEYLIPDLKRMMNAKVKYFEHDRMQGLICKMKDFMSSQTKNLKMRKYDTQVASWSGVEIIAQLGNLGITRENFQMYKDTHAKICEKEDDFMSGKRGKDPTKEVKLSGFSRKVLEGLFTVLDYIFRHNMKYTEDFRMTIVKTIRFLVQHKNQEANTNDVTLSKKTGKRKMEETFDLNFWCMNPAVAFSDLVDTRSVVLTSGTLSPMDSFQSELGMPFPIKLEAPHVINSDQVWVGSIAQGPKGVNLRATYANTEMYNFQDDLGSLILDVCKTVPYGVLCFFSSYSVLEKFSLRWKMTGLWENLEQHKQVMSEPRASDKVDFDGLLQNFYQIIEETDAGNIDDDRTGALFLAVCRGKVSEGMDFADNNARAVITVGIPFPSIKDSLVELKKQYNNQYCKSRGLLTGNEWYEIQAYRAINQALGRCIRHKQDWGALILVDDRFGNNPQKYIKGLSKWVRSKVKHHNNYRAALDSLKQFTVHRQANPVQDTSVMMSPCLSQVGYPPATQKLHTLCDTPHIRDTHSDTPHKVVDLTKDSPHKPMDAPKSTIGTKDMNTSNLNHGESDALKLQPQVHIVDHENKKYKIKVHQSVSQKNVSLIIDTLRCKYANLVKDTKFKISVFDPKISPGKVLVEVVVSRCDEEEVRLIEQSVSQTSIENDAEKDGHRSPGESANQNLNSMDIKGHINSAKEPLKDSENMLKFVDIPSRKSELKFERDDTIGASGALTPPLFESDNQSTPESQPMSLDYGKINTTENAGSKPNDVNHEVKCRRPIFKVTKHLDEKSEDELNQDGCQTSRKPHQDETIANVNDLNQEETVANGLDEDFCELDELNTRRAKKKRKPTPLKSDKMKRTRSESMGTTDHPAVDQDAAIETGEAITVDARCPKCRTLIATRLQGYKSDVVPSFLQANNQVYYFNEMDKLPRKLKIIESGDLNATWSEDHCVQYVTCASKRCSMLDTPTSLGAVVRVCSSHSAGPVRPNQLWLLQDAIK